MFSKLARISSSTAYRVRGNVTATTTRSFATTASTNGPDDFLTGTNSIYAEQMYDAWRTDPKSVHASWSSYFSNLDNGLASKDSFTTPHFKPSVSPSSASNAVESDSLGISYLIRAYQVRGHEIANLDPLGIHSFRQDIPHELDHKFHGFTDADLDRPLNLFGKATGGNVGFLDILGSQPSNLTLRQVITNLQKTYCGNLGVEYMHIGSKDKCNWIRSQVETPKWLKFSKEKKLHIYERLCYATQFETYLANKFNTAKRFGLEGGESCIPGLKFLIDHGSELGIESFVFGMPHRGRLNVLANVLRKPLRQIFQEFQGIHYNSVDEYNKSHDDDWSSSGDVKYHLGTQVNRTYPDGRQVHLSLLANPSHLEAVNPVVLGKVRAKQFLNGNREEDKKKVLPILLHGDAAFAGQGIVYETMQLAKVPDFAVGGTIHVIVNNQVGFTTDPTNGRSTLYSSDLGKAFNIPIFHCNGDDVSAVVNAFEMAVEWRQKYGEDCIIDLICYRRNGHNELDQPMYTQPKLYAKIKSHPDTLAVYGKQLVQDGVATQEQLNEIKTAATNVMEKEYNESKTWKTPPGDWLSSKWKGFLSPKQLSRIRPTGVALNKLEQIGLAMTTIPSHVQIHSQLEKIIAARKETIRSGEGIDFATAEALAFGTLLLEGNHVRLTGQDVQRGTFSHRHAVLINQLTQESYNPLNHLAKYTIPSAPLTKQQPALTSTVTASSLANSTTTTNGIEEEIQAEFTCRNSILSEYGVLGYELGYSLENPNMLILWEAQFGDFVNGAQIILDQFLSAGEDKWLRQSGLTLLLPHGYMGQGAEHSSCRIERFLQQVDEDSDVVPPMEENERKQIQVHNWQIVNVTTPANYYHVLRRQVHRDFRKPLVIASTKNLLREKKATSKLIDFTDNTHFQRVYGETNANINNDNNKDKVRRILLVSGKIYYELVEEREKKGITDVAVVRLEQVAPFPWDHVAEEISKYPNAEVVWVQEEPKNMGCWTFVEPRIATATRVLNKQEKRPRFIGRKPAAATATGLGNKAHNAEQNELIAAALAL